MTAVRTKGRREANTILKVYSEGTKFVFKKRGACDAESVLRKAVLSRWLGRNEDVLETKQQPQSGPPLLAMEIELDSTLTQCFTIFCFCHCLD